MNRSMLGAWHENRTVHPQITQTTQIIRSAVRRAFFSPRWNLRNLRISGFRAVWPDNMLVAPIIATLLLAVLTACGSEKTAGKSETLPVRAAVVVATATDETRTIDAVGSLRSTREAVIASKVMGTVTEIRKNSGDAVRAGEIVLVIDSRDVAGQVQQAKGALAQAQAASAIAETNFRRFEQLFAKGAASQLELDQARYQYDTAKGAVAQAEGAVATATSYQSNAEVSAPFDGRIVDRLCEVGDMAAPGRPLLKIEDSRRVRLDVSLTVQNLAAVSVGSAVAVDIPAIGTRTFQGKVAEIVPAADPATHSFLVKIEMPQDEALRAGLYGRAHFSAGTYKAIRIPREAVVTRGGLTGVYFVENGRAIFRLVTLADDSSQQPEVLAGLSGGESVVLVGGRPIEEGSAVEVER